MVIVDTVVTSDFATPLYLQLQRRGERRATINEVCLGDVEFLVCVCSM